jgi:hypothetical protein
MEAVYVLGGIDVFDDLGRIELLGQGELHQDAVDARILVQPEYQFPEFALGRIRWKIIGFGARMPAEIFFPSIRRAVMDSWPGSSTGFDSRMAERCRTRKIGRKLTGYWGGRIILRP